ncbi:hypothetical protein Adt_21598 [Abeliophyllum distichum]|uniref:Uncharacterized protein n=1 Tax=Abeliophyllum distichum TaxID=126358 RepID=A0ABD1SZT1_9LAMI
MLVRLGRLTNDRGVWHIAGGDGDVDNSSTYEDRVRITHRNSKLDPAALELLLVLPVIIVEVYSTLEGFDGKLGKEKANSKKLSEDLKVMSLEKAQLESKKWFLQVKLDTVVARKADLKAQHECFEEAQKLAKERAFACKIAAATVNSTLEAVVVEKDSLLAEVKEEIERIKADHVDAYARAGTAYQDGFEGTPEYKDLAHHFMPAKGK